MKRDFKIFCANKAELERADLQLYKIGTFDTVTGKIEPIEPVFIMGGHE